jgi:hypothetical protein
MQLSIFTYDEFLSHCVCIITQIQPSGMLGKLSEIVDQMQIVWNLGQEVKHFAFILIKSIDSLKSFINSS